MKTRTFVSTLALSTAVALTAVLTGCTSGTASSDAAGTAHGDSGTVSVVASTNVYGDIAREHRRRRRDGHPADVRPRARPALVRSERSEPARDLEGRHRHRERRRLRRFHGHDAEGVEQPRPPCSTRSDISGKKPVDGQLNEHVWYDFPTMQKLADPPRRRPREGRSGAGGDLHHQRCGVRGEAHGARTPHRDLKKTHAGEGVADHRTGSALSARGDRSGRQDAAPPSASPSRPGPTSPPPCSSRPSTCFTARR